MTTDSTLEYRLPWRLQVDPETDEVEPGIRFCKVLTPNPHYAIAHGWEYPHIFRLVAAAPDLLDALRSLVSASAQLEGIDELALQRARNAIVKATVEPA